jgi:hypothetical protein
MESYFSVSQQNPRFPMSDTGLNIGLFVLYGG